MIELLYISEQLPLIKSRDSGSKKNASQTESDDVEWVPVVEPGGLVTGRTQRENAHAGGLLHPVVHLQIVNRRGEIFLQKRSSSKQVYPDMWDSAVGGHVLVGEIFEEALYREARQELEFTLFNPYRLASYIYESQTDRELVALYGAVGNFSLNPHNEEVEKGEWWTVQQIEKNLGRGVFTPNFIYEWQNYKENILAML